MKKYKDICRNKIYNDKDRFLMSQILVGSEEEKKILNVNCGGYGRIRIFKKNKFNDWNCAPIPMV